MSEKGPASDTDGVRVDVEQGLALFKSELARLKWDSDYGGCYETQKVFDAFGTVLRGMPYHTAEQVRELLKAERVKCAELAESWSKPSVVKLAAGEMTAQELRTAQAVARGIAAVIRKQP